MVRGKQSFHYVPGTVQLLLTGPRSILSGHMLVSANLSSTWYELLNREVGLPVKSDSGIFVCTKSYKPCNQKNDAGWRAELNEKIGEFINKFERTKRQYTVRICNPSDILARQQISPITATTTRNVSIAPRTLTRASMPQQNRLVIPSQKTTATAFKAQSNKPGNNIANGGLHIQNVNRQSGNQFNKKINVALRQKRARAGNSSVSQTQARHNRIEHVQPVVKIESVVEPEWNPLWDDTDNNSSKQSDPLETESDNSVQDSSGHCDMEEEEIDDNASLCTAATQEANELRRQGIHVEDVLSSVQGRMTRFSNAYMLKVRNEIRKLKKNNLWDRNASRAPLASYLLQEMFKD